MSYCVTKLKEQRDHMATLWRNIRYHERQHKDSCAEHAALLRKAFAPLLTIKLRRIPRHKP